MSIGYHEEQLQGGSTIQPTPRGDSAAAMPQTSFMLADTE